MGLNIDMSGHHLAQFNVARLKYPVDDPRIADFVANLERVNLAAERMPGFVWRFKDESGNSTGVAIKGDPLLIPNFSVWESAEALEGYVWNTVHKFVYARRAEWFEAHEASYLVMWRIAPGEIPTLDEAIARLDDLRENGPTEHAFGWENLPNVAQWREQRCA